MEENASEEIADWTGFRHNVRMIKAVAICGSRHAAGTTEQLLKRTLERLGRKGIEVKQVNLLWKTVHPCIHCGSCDITRNGRCTLEGDDFPVLYKALTEANIILIGAPVDLGMAPADLKHFLERSLRVARASDNALSRKIGAPIPVLAKEVSKHSLQRLLAWFPAQGIIVPGAAAYPLGKETVELALRSDEAGETVVDELADNLAWLAGKVF